MPVVSYNFVKHYATIEAARASVADYENCDDSEDDETYGATVETHWLAETTPIFDDAQLAVETLSQLARSLDQLDLSRGIAVGRFYRVTDAGQAPIERDWKAFSERLKTELEPAPAGIANSATPAAVSVAAAAAARNDRAAAAAVFAQCRDCHSVVNLNQLRPANAGVCPLCKTAPVCVLDAVLVAEAKRTGLKDVGTVGAPLSRKRTLYTPEDDAVLVRRRSALANEVRDYVAKRRRAIAVAPREVWYMVAVSYTTAQSEAEAEVEAEAVDVPN